MRAVRAWFARLTSLFRRGRAERELADELESLVEMHVEDNLRAGMSPSEARRQALVRVGGLEVVKESVRESRGFPRLEAVGRDVRLAARALRRSPGFTLVVVLSLAAGIGGNSAAFSVVNAILLRRLPVRAPDELATLQADARAHAPQRFSYPTFGRLREVVPALAAVSRVARMDVRTGAREDPTMTPVQLVSGELFPVLGLAPARGRLLSPADNGPPGSPAVAIVSHAFWSRRMDAAGDVTERSLLINGRRFEIVGVAPAGFSGLWLESPTEVWIPVAMQASVGYSQNFSAEDSAVDQPWLGQDGIRWLDLIVRVSPGARSRTTAMLGTVMGRALRHPEEWRLGLQPFARGFSNLRERSAGMMFALMGMLAGLLAIACANAANLLLARAAARRHELALRMAVGANRARLVQQLLVESLILAALAGGLGLLLAPTAAEVLLRMATGVRIGELPFAAPIDGPVLLFGVGISMATSLAVGLVPALRATEVDLRGALRNGVGAGGPGRSRPARLLVVSQVSLSLILLVVAGLFLRSLDNLARVELGFDKEHLVSVSMSPRMGGFSPSELAPLYRRLVERVEALPGVRSAAVATSRLASGDRARSDKVIAGYQKQPGEEVVIQENRVGPHYFSTLGRPLIAGRDFDDHDFAAGAPVAIVNQAFARRYFPDRSPLGQRFGEDRPDVEIVGVVQDARVNDVREDPRPMAYYPLREAAYASSLDVRTTADPRWLSDRLKRAIVEAEPRLPLERVRTVAQQVDGTLNPDRAAARLTAALGLLALGLACFGLYGVMSYAVARRTSELGLRLALGASRGRVLGMVLRDALRLVELGLLLGLPAALAASRLLSTELFGVGTEAPLVLGATAALLAVAAAAALAPAWRASRVDPMIALRCE